MSDGLFLPEAPDLLGQAAQFKQMQMDQQRLGLYQQGIYQDELNRQTRAAGIRLDVLTKALEIAPTGGPAESILTEILGMAGVDGSQIDWAAGAEEMKSLVMDARQSIMKDGEAGNLPGVSITLNTTLSSLGQLANRYKLHAEDAKVYEEELKGLSNTIMGAHGAMAQGRAFGDLTAGGTPNADDIRTISYTQGPEKVAPYIRGTTDMRRADVDAQGAANAKDRLEFEREKFDAGEVRKDKKQRFERGQERFDRKVAISQELDRLRDSAFQITKGVIAADPRYSDLFKSIKGDDLASFIAGIQGQAGKGVSDSDDPTADEKSLRAQEFIDDFNATFEQTVQQLAGRNPLLRNRSTTGPLIPSPFSRPTTTTTETTGSPTSSTSRPSLPDSGDYEFASAEEYAALIRAGYTPEELEAQGVRIQP